MNLRYYKLKYFVLIVLGIASLCIWLASIGVPNQILKYFSPAFLVSLFLWVFDKWLWKLPVCSLLMAVPNISGLYSGQIEFMYKGEKRSKSCTMKVRQSSTRVDVETSFVGDEKDEPSTTSYSLVASIINDERMDKFKLVFFYENKGSCVAGDTLNQHYGTNVLDIMINKQTIELTGYYYTNRKPNQTMGKMKVFKQNS